MPGVFVCQFCYRSKPTRQGLRSHLAQNRLCRRAFHETLQTASPVVPEPSGQPVPNNVEQDLRQLEPEADTYPSPSSPADPSPPTRSRSAYVEDCPDESEGQSSESIKADGLPRSLHVLDYPGAGEPVAMGTTPFEELRKAREALGSTAWAPFESEEEWGLARWLMMSGLSQEAIDDFLKPD